MSTENDGQVEEIVGADGLQFWNSISWDMVTYNKITKDDFLRVKSVNPKLYATFLG